MTFTAPDTWMDCSCPKLIILELVFMASPKRQYLGTKGLYGALPPSQVSTKKFFVRERQLFEQKLSMKMRRFNYWLTRNKTP